MLNSYFTTIRPFSPTKHIVGVLKKCQYPRKGEMVEFVTEIVDVTVVMLDSIPDFLFRIDLGYSKEESIRMIENMYKNKGIDVHTHRFVILTLKHRPDLEERAMLHANNTSHATPMHA